MPATLPAESGRRSSTIWISVTVVSTLMLLAVGVLAATHTGPRLLTDPRSPGGIHPATLSFGGTIAVGRHHCITTGGAVLVAPQGSSVSLDGRSVTLAGIGTYRIGEELPRFGGLRTDTIPASDLPAHLRACGPGTFELIWS